MALLVHQQFAVDAFVALSSETPDTVCTDGTVGSLFRGADGVKNNHHEQTHIMFQGDAAAAVVVAETCNSMKFYQSHCSVTLTCLILPLINKKINYHG